MKIYLCVLLMAMVTACGKNRQIIGTHDLEKWLKYQGEIDVVVDSAGVGLAKNPTRIQASLYRLRQTVTDCSVVVEFDVNLPAGGPIVEYVAGSGDTEDKAIDQAMNNFSDTTMHVIYKAFLNSSDTHQPVESVVINGTKREMLTGAMVQYAVGNASSAYFERISARVHDLIVALPLTPGPHWIKIAYSQNFNQPIAVSSTLDNKDASGLTSAVQSLDWPRRGEFYMVKQFILVE